ncbi:unnamed protein product [Amoebophrya sp. A120]|nr:unnamed protein product [Amoebophrya sp. A120]|eukprot:GSA120T00012230001.1
MQKAISFGLPPVGSTSGDELIPAASSMSSSLSSQQQHPKSADVDGVATRNLDAATDYNLPPQEAFYPVPEVSQSELARQRALVDKLEKWVLYQMAKMHSRPLEGMFHEKHVQRFFIEREISVPKFRILDTWRPHYEAFGRFRFDRRPPPSWTWTAILSPENASVPNLPTQATGQIDQHQMQLLTAKRDVPQHSQYLDRYSTHTTSTPPSAMAVAVESARSARENEQYSNVGKGKDHSTTPTHANATPGNEANASSNVGRTAGASAPSSQKPPLGTTTAAAASPTVIDSSTKPPHQYDKPVYAMTGSTLPILDASRVPVMLLSPERLNRKFTRYDDDPLFADEPQLDLTLFEVVPFINGLHNISQIAKLSGCDLENVDLVIRHLVKSRWVFMIDPIHEFALYRLKPEFYDFFHREFYKLQKFSHAFKLAIAREQKLMWNEALLLEKRNNQILERIRMSTTILDGTTGKGAAFHCSGYGVGIPAVAGGASAAFSQRQLQLQQQLSSQNGAYYSQQLQNSSGVAQPTTRSRDQHGSFEIEMNIQGAEEGDALMSSRGDALMTEQVAAHQAQPVSDTNDGRLRDYLLRDELLGGQRPATTAGDHGQYLLAPSPTSSSEKAIAMRVCRPSRASSSGFSRASSSSKKHVDLEPELTPSPPSDLSSVESLMRTRDNQRRMSNCYEMIGYMFFTQPRILQYSKAVMRRREMTQILRLNGIKPILLKKRVFHKNNALMQVQQGQAQTASGAQMLVQQGRVPDGAGGAPNQSQSSLKRDKTAIKNTMNLTSGQLYQAQPPGGGAVAEAALGPPLTEPQGNNQSQQQPNLAHQAGSTVPRTSPALSAGSGTTGTSGTASSRSLATTTTSLSGSATTTNANLHHGTSSNSNSRNLRHQQQQNRMFHSHPFLYSSDAEKGINRVIPEEDEEDLLHLTPIAQPTIVQNLRALSQSPRDGEDEATRGAGGSTTNTSRATPVQLVEPLSKSPAVANTTSVKLLPGTRRSETGGASGGSSASSLSSSALIHPSGGTTKPARGGGPTKTFATSISSPVMPPGSCRAVASVAVVAAPTAGVVLKSSPRASSVSSNSITSTNSDPASNPRRTNVNLYDIHSPGPGVGMPFSPPERTRLTSPVVPSGQQHHAARQLRQEGSATDSGATARAGLPVAAPVLKVEQVGSSSTVGKMNVVGGAGSSNTAATTSVVETRGAARGNDASNEISNENCLSLTEELQRCLCLISRVQFYYSQMSPHEFLGQFQAKWLPAQGLDSDHKVHARRKRELKKKQIEEQKLAEAVAAAKKKLQEAKEKEEAALKEAEDTAKEEEGKKSDSEENSCSKDKTEAADGVETTETTLKKNTEDTPASPKAASTTSEKPPAPQEEQLPAAETAKAPPGQGIDNQGAAQGGRPPQARKHARLLPATMHEQLLVLAVKKAREVENERKQQVEARRNAKSAAGGDGTEGAQAEKGENAEAAGAAGSCTPGNASGSSTAKSEISAEPKIKRVNIKDDITEAVVDINISNKSKKKEKPSAGADMTSNGSTPTNKGKTKPELSSAVFTRLEKLKRNLFQSMDGCYVHKTIKDSYGMGLRYFKTNGRDMLRQERKRRRRLRRSRKRAEKAAKQRSTTCASTLKDQREKRKAKRDKKLQSEDKAKLLLQLDAASAIESGAQLSSPPGKIKSKSPFRPSYLPSGPKIRNFQHDTQHVAEKVLGDSSYLSLRHFILFGLAHNFLTRILEYPLVRLKKNLHLVQQRPARPGEECFVDLDLFVQLCDGTMHLERIALLAYRDVSQLRHLLTHVLPKDPRVDRVTFLRR